MKKLSKNNKGFSLVELIVVVLIMGIIAVALAPQVMKWVGTSRKNTDENQKATIKASAQTAVADYMKDCTIGTSTYKIAKTDITAEGTDANTATNEEGKTLIALFKEVMGGSNFPEPVDSGSNFYITVTEAGAVSVDTTAPASGGGSTPAPTTTPTT